MADTKISALPSAVTLTGVELIPMVQSGVDVSATVNQVGQFTLGKLTANTTYFVNAGTGNDANVGSAGAPWATLQHAYNWVQANINLAGFSVIFDCTGTFNAGVFAQGPIVGQSSAVNVTYSFHAGSVVNGGTNCFGAAYGAQFQVGLASGGSLTVTATSAGGIAFQATSFGFLSIVGNVTIGNVAGAGVQLSWFGTIIFGTVTVTVTNTTNIANLIFVSGGLLQFSPPSTWTINGSFTVSNSFARSYGTGVFGFNGTTFNGSGTVTGPKYLCDLNGVMSSGGVTLPGSAGGSTATGGQYT